MPAISSILAPSNPRLRNTLRAASRIRSSTSPASSLGGRPDRPGARVTERAFVGEILVAEVFAAEVLAISSIFISQIARPASDPTARRGTWLKLLTQPREKNDTVSFISCAGQSILLYRRTKQFRFDYFT